MDPDSNKQLKYLTGGLSVIPIDLSGTLLRSSSKTYKTRSESKIDMIVDRDWSVEQLAEYDVKGSLTYTRKIDGKEITDINHINKKGLPGITYHDCIGPNNIWHTLPYGESSYHAAGYNGRSVAIAMLYRTTNPDTNRAEYAPNQGIFKLTQCHAAELCFKFGLAPDRIVGHRELKGTGWDWIRGRKRLLKSCPGPHVNMDLLRKNAALYMQVRLKTNGYYSGAIDGDFGPLSRAALELYKGSE
jgi:hypothetical protein